MTTSERIMGGLEGIKFALLSAGALAAVFLFIPAALVAMLVAMGLLLIVHGWLWQDPARIADGASAFVSIWEGIQAFSPLYPLAVTVVGLWCAALFILGLSIGEGGHEQE